MFTCLVQSIWRSIKMIELSILNPTIADLMDNNIYKLYVDEELYLVPLWHNEIYFDSAVGEIIVLCNPILSNELTIDENNNIYIEKKMSLNSDLLDNEFVSLDIGGKTINIVVNELLIKRRQIYRIRREGISKIVEKDIYNVSCKSDIIVNVTIE